MDEWLTKLPIEYKPEPTLFIRWDEFGRFNILSGLPSQKQLEELHNEQSIKMAEAEKSRGDALIRECEFNAKMEKTNKKFELGWRLIVCGLLVLWFVLVNLK